MNIAAQIKHLRTEITGQVALNGLQTNGTITEYALSTEDMHETAVTAAKAGIDVLNSVIASAVDSVLATESMTGEFMASQRESAESIAALALRPRSLSYELTAPSHSATADMVSVEDMGVFDAVDPSELSLEGFDDQAINNSLFLSVAFNMYAPKQDPFGELMFPTISIDPTKSGITISTDVISVYQNYDRSITGADRRNLLNKVTLAKAIFDNTIMGAERNAVVPVLRAESTPNMLDNLSTVSTLSGTDITTAPLRTGMLIDVLGISQTDAMLAKGTMDAYDTLDRTVSLTELTFSLTAVIATVSTTEYFKVPVGMYPGSNFAYTPQGHDKDLGLSFDSEDIMFLTSNTLTHDGSTSAILATLPAGHTVRLSTKISGSGNTAFGGIEVYTNSVSILNITDATDTLVPATGAVMTTFKAVFDTIAIPGYTLEAYMSNAAMRTEAMAITTDTHQQVYNVPTRTGVQVVVPINSTSGDDSSLIGQIQATGYRMSAAAASTLREYTDRLAVMTTNGLNANIKTMGIARHHVDAYYKPETLDLPQLVDSESSSERAADIRAVLIAKIRDHVLLAYSQSNFNVAHELIHGAGAIVGVAIGTSSRVKNYLCGSNSNTIDIGTGFDVRVESTANSLIGDSMYITFTEHKATNRNTEINPIGFGNCVWAPTVTTDVATTVGGSTKRKYQTHPRYLHIVHLPVMIRLAVTNIEAVLGKVSRQTTVV